MIAVALHRFTLASGESVVINDAQLGALHSMPAQYTSWPTYWALRRRKLIEGSQNHLPTRLSERGKEVVEMDRKRNGKKT